MIFNFITLMLTTIATVNGQADSCTAEVANIERQSGILQSPQYPQNYAANTICRWRLGNVKGGITRLRSSFLFISTCTCMLNQVIHPCTVGTIIRVNFIDIDIELDAACRWDFVQFTSSGQSPDKHCGSDVPDLLRLLLLSFDYSNYPKVIADHC